VALITEVAGDDSAPLVLMVNVAVVLPAGTVTEDGTVATEVVPDVRLTTIPPAGAAAESVTVPVEVPPAETVVGLIVKVVNVGFETEPI